MTTKLKYLILTLVLLLVIICVAVSFLAYRVYRELNPTSEERAAQERDGRIALNKELAPRIKAASKTPITFYGRVVDQHGQPVVGAEVEHSIYRTVPTGTIEYAFAGTALQKPAITDRDGNFRIKSNGIDLRVTGIRCSGYDEKGIEHDKYKFHYAFVKGLEDINAHIHQPDPTKPVVYCMRKKEKVEPLVRIGLRGGELKQWKAWYSLAFGHPMQKGRKGNAFAYVSVQNNGADGCCFTIECSDGNGIVQRGSSEYVAPQREVFKKTMNIQVPNGESLNKDLFILVRGGKYFGRLKMNLTVPRTMPKNAPWVRFRKAFLNLNGSRVLELEESVQAKHLEEITIMREEFLGIK